MNSRTSSNGDQQDGRLTSDAGRWLRLLAPNGSTPVPEPVSDPELLEEVTNRLGSGPVEWAAQVGAETAARVSRNVSLFANDPNVRLGTESATLTAMLMLTRPTMVAPPITEDAKHEISQYALRGIPLDQVLSGIRSGHAGMAEAFMTACERLVAEDERVREMHRVASWLFDHIDRFAHMAANFYEEERRRNTASPQLRKLAAVRRLLGSGGEEFPTGTSIRDSFLDEASRTLDYDFGGNHVALIIEAAPGISTQMPVDVRRAAFQLAREVPASQRLVVSADDETWLWLGSPSNRGVSTDHLGDVPEGVVVSIGSPGSGIHGFQSSHLQASEVSRLRRTSTTLPPLWKFEDAELILLLISDFGRAQAFVERHLAGLLERSATAEDLRRTLKAYMDAHASPNMAAQRLHVARNTVSARVHKASLLLNRDLTGEILDLHTALLLVELFGDSLLPS